MEFIENDLYTLIEDSRSHKPAGNDVSSCFRSAFIEVRKTADIAASDGFVCIKSNAVSKASSNFWSEEYRQRYGLKWRGVSPSSILGWASLFHIALLSGTPGVRDSRGTMAVVRVCTQISAQLWHGK